AAEIAVLIGERGLGGDDVDLTQRLSALRRDRSPRPREARALAARWAEIAAAVAAVPSSLEGAGKFSTGALLALAYPERVAKNRGGGAGVFVLANGRGAQIDPASPLAREPYLAVAELAGSAAAGRILLAAPIALADIEARFAHRIVARDEIAFDPASASLRQRRLRRFGAITLAEQPLSAVASEAAAPILAAGIVQLGIDRLPWSKGLRQWRDRVMFLRASEGQEWPDLSDAALAATLGDWLGGVLAGKIALRDITADELQQALTALLPWPLQLRLEAEAPTHFEAPTGSRTPIDYLADGGPKIAIRLQELFGLDRHPAIAGGKIPLVIELLSPAHRPVQTTRDLPGFWRGSYAAVRAEMRGRYAKHPWPADPLAAAATRRAKPRKA
ncbi:MAG TPA: ATP-dependent helicase C-terminal domain-containing protein, partial [Xanthobacteraceae bacterium]|nr:ATP-dependent helicase C-terminal domain-containing protein [Xanthobacteraceae bacterium]